MERLPRPTMAQPNFLPGGSGTRSCAEAFFNRASAAVVASRPRLALLMKLRRVISLGELVIACLRPDRQHLHSPDPNAAGIAAPELPLSPRHLRRPPSPAPQLA